MTAVMEIRAKSSTLKDIRYYLRVTTLQQHVQHMLSPKKRCIQGHLLDTRDINRNICIDLAKENSRMDIKFSSLERKLTHVRGCRYDKQLQNYNNFNSQYTHFVLANKRDFQRKIFRIK